MNRMLWISGVFLMLLSSCFKSDDCDPNKVCITERPDSAWVNIDFSYSRFNTPIPFVIYNGDVEDELIVMRDTAYLDLVSYYLPVDERYSIKAVYSVNGQTITAYDGGKLKLYKGWNCDERCYDAPDLNLDCKLLE